MRRMHVSREKITTLILSCVLAAFILPSSVAHADSNSLLGISGKTKNSLKETQVVQNFLNYETIVVPSALCEDEAKTIRRYEKVEKQKIKKTSWYPYYDMGKAKKYKKYKKNAAVCVATYATSYPALEEYNEVPGVMLFSFFEDKNCIKKAEKILPDKNWRELASAETFGSCLILGQNISPKEAMQLIKHPKAKYVEYDAILTIPPFIPLIP